MSFQVFLTRDTVRDLEELDETISASDSGDKADYVLSKIDTAMQRLCESPERSARPRELLALGVGEVDPIPDTVKQPL